MAFLVSIGFYSVQERSKKKGFRIRLRQEFELIRDELKRDMDKGNIVARGFRRDHYQSHTKELLEIVDANTWQTVVNTDGAIHELGSPENIREKYTTNTKIT